MTHDESVSLSAEIGRYIARYQPQIVYTEDDVLRDRAQYSELDLFELEELGMMPCGYEAYFVIREFLHRVGATDVAEGDYLLALFRDAKKLDADEFEKDPFLENIRITEQKRGNILLTTVAYRRGEVFLYDMPDFTRRLVTPKLGFFDREIRFPSVYEGDMPWISVCPSEINSMSRQIAMAHGRVLILGLGIGYYTYRCALRAEVSEITVVELSEDVIAIFREQILPQFPNPEKIHIVHADAIAYMKQIRDCEYDFCFADIWEGAVDGAPLYEQIRAEAEHLPNLEMTYWIEEQIKAYLDE